MAAGTDSSLFVHDPDLLEVGIGEIVVAEAPQRLMTPALGSCVGLAIWDPYHLRGGLAHIMLPTSAVECCDELPGRFAEYAVPELVARLEKSGSMKRRLRAKIAGGASMFRADAAIAGIGDRNVAEVERLLQVHGIEVVGRDVGDTHARTVELVLETGELIVRSYQFGVRHL